MSRFISTVLKTLSLYSGGFYKLWESFEFCFSVYRFSSGDLSQDCDEVEQQQQQQQQGDAPVAARPIPPPLQTQPMPGGPPNIPPPPGL